MWVLITAFVFIASVTCSAPAFAQGAPSLGGNTDGQKLDLRASGFGSYTDNVLGDLAGAGGGQSLDISRGSGTQGAGLYSGLSGDLSYGYSKRKGSASFSLNARSSGSYFPDLDIKSFQHLADAMISKQMGVRTSVRFSQSARMSDLYRLELFPDTASDEPQTMLRLGDEYGLIARRTYAFITSTGLSHRVTSRATLSLHYGLRRVESPDLDFSFMSHSPGVSLHYRLTRYGGIRASYSYRTATRETTTAQGLGQVPLESHDVSLGMDYNRAFSLSGRRTSLTFTTGSSLFATGREEEQGDQATTSANLRPVLQGSVTLRRNLGRTWDAHASYNRMVQFVDGFTHPMLIDALSAGINGQIGPHVRANALIAHAFGGEGRNRLPNRDYGSKLAAVEFAHPLFWQFDVFAQYFFFRQEVGEGIVLPQAVPHTLNRQSVRVGLTWRVAIIS
jgi:hypothetical protein